MQKEENNSFSRKVRMIRLDYGLTQPDLAKLMDVSVRTVASWESEGKKRKHELMLWDQIQKEVESKAKKKVGEAKTITNTGTEDKMLQKELIEAYRKIVERDERIFELEKLLRGKPQTSKAKKAN